jgi:hypothetical protein
MYKAGVTIPYSKEYQLQQPNTELLQNIANATGGKVLKNSSEAFRKLPNNSFEQQGMMIWLIFIAMILLFIDITLRRFGWQKIRGLLSKSKHNNGRKKDDSHQLDVDVLLKNKRK